jgi:hypothetical protein
MMELGQTICLPHGPRCSACPLAIGCGGYRSGNPEDFPIPRPRRAAESHYLAVALLRRGTRVALARGLDEGLLDDLWNFPSTFGGSPAPSAMPPCTGSRSRNYRKQPFPNWPARLCIRFLGTAPSVRLLLEHGASEGGRRSQHQVPDSHGQGRELIDPGKMTCLPEITYP